MQALAVTDAKKEVIDNVPVAAADLRVVIVEEVSFIKEVCAVVFCVVVEGVPVIEEVHAVV